MRLKHVSLDGWMCVCVREREKERERLRQRAKMSDLCEKEIGVGVRTYLKE